jgi:hypothetical protein
MKYSMLALSIALVMPVRAPARTDPPIRLRLSDNTLTSGQREKIRVRTATDGYLVVLRTDTQGNVRVLFPLNPTDDGSIQGGRDFEVRGRGDRDAFAASGQPGSGTVLAAWAPQPFTFTDFESNGHWVRAGLVADSAAADPEAVMLGVVDRMSAGPYKYDMDAYTVTHREYREAYGGWYRPWYGSWYDPWYGGAFAPWSWYPYSYGPGVGLGIVVRPRIGGRRYR